MKVEDEYINGEEEDKALLESKNDREMMGHSLPNPIYLSRQKSLISSIISRVVPSMLWYFPNFFTLSNSKRLLSIKILKKCIASQDKRKILIFFFYYFFQEYCF